jgi:hypothetical protein
MMDIRQPSRSIKFKANIERVLPPRPAFNSRKCKVGNISTLQRLSHKERPGRVVAPLPESIARQLALEAHYLDIREEKEARSNTCDPARRTVIFGTDAAPTLFAIAVNTSVADMRINDTATQTANCSNEVTAQVLGGGSSALSLSRGV